MQLLHVLVFLTIVSCTIIQPSSGILGGFKSFVKKLSKANNKANLNQGTLKASKSEQTVRPPIVFPTISVQEDTNKITTNKVPKKLHKCQTLATLSPQVAQDATKMKANEVITKTNSSANLMPVKENEGLGNKPKLNSISAKSAVQNSSVRTLINQPSSSISRVKSKGILKKEPSKEPLNNDAIQLVPQDDQSTQQVESPRDAQKKTVTWSNDIKAYKIYDEKLL